MGKIQTNIVILYRGKIVLVYINKHIVFLVMFDFYVVLILI